MNFPPSAVNLNPLPQSRVPDNSSQAQLLAALGGQIGQGLEKRRLQKKKDENAKRATDLSNQLLNGEVTPEQEERGLEQAQIAIQERQQLNEVERQAQQREQQIQQRTTLERILNDPEDSATFLELQQLNPQMAQTLMQIAVGGDQNQKQQVAQQAQEAQRINSNFLSILQSGGIEEARNYYRDEARKVYQAGGDVSGMTEILSSSPDKAAGLATKQLALSGAALKIKELKPISQLDQAKLEIDKKRLGLEERRVAATEKNAETERAAISENNLKDTKKLEKETKQNKKIIADTRRNTKRVTTLIDKAIKLSTNDAFIPNTGRLGAISSVISPTGDSGRLRRMLETLKSNIGLDTLIDIKSKGGTLGALNKEELLSLQNKIANLSPDQGSDELVENLKIIKDDYLSVLQSVDSEVAPSSSILDDARAAIERGAPRDLVLQRLRENGITNTEL